MCSILHCILACIGIVQLTARTLYSTIYVTIYVTIYGRIKRCIYTRQYTRPYIGYDYTGYMDAADAAAACALPRLARLPAAAALSNMSTVCRLAVHDVPSSSLHCAALRGRGGGCAADCWLRRVVMCARPPRHVAS